MTNGQDLVVSAVMKPIPTMLKPLNSVDLKTKENAQAHYERSDVCAVESCAVVAEARVAWVLANEILLKYGADSIEELKSRIL
jgi:chorismate synthase